MTDENIEAKGIAGKTVDGAKTATQAVVDNPGHSIVGAVIGQILIPVPVVGAVVGAYAGGWFGSKNSPQA